jgi:radical SAM superfamily enzyme YgiQ (UPF0313 family)
MARRDIERQIRHLRASEKADCVPRRDAAYRFGIIYPNSYHLGMSNLGHQLIWRIVNERPGWACERFYTDFDPPLSMESCASPSEFDILAFSVAYELDYVHVLDFLKRSGIPLRSADRSAGYPVIIGAGVCVDVNRLPVYDNMDVLVNSEGEEVTEALLALHEQHGHDRREFLQALSLTPGFEVTAGAARHHNLDVPDADGCDVPRRPRLVTQRLERFMCCSHIVTPNTEFADMCLVELARGCPYRCTFCYVGHNLNPYRCVPLAMLKDWITERRAWTQRFGFVASAVASHPDIDELCAFCDDLGVSVSYSSLRAEDVTVPMIRTLARSGTRTLTIAPEAGSFRLRRLLGKARLPDERIEWVVEEALRAGIPNLKMYFMIGLPTETEDDILAISSLVARIQRGFVAGSRHRGRIGSISLNVSIFVPKHNTPLEKFEMMPFREVRRHSALLQKSLAKINNLRIQAPSVSLAQVQGILSMGDRRANRLLLAALAHGGNWKSALRDYLGAAAHDDVLAAAV